MIIVYIIIYRRLEVVRYYDEDGKKNGLMHKDRRKAMFKAETNRWKLVIKVTKPWENAMARINPNDLFMQVTSWQTSAWCFFHAIKPTTPYYSFKPISTIFSNRSFNTSKRTLDAETKTKNHDRIVQLKVLAVLKEKSTKKIKIIASFRVRQCWGHSKVTNDNLKKKNGLHLMIYKVLGTNCKYVTKMRKNILNTLTF